MQTTSCASTKMDVANYMQNRLSLVHIFVTILRILLRKLINQIDTVNVGDRPHRPPMDPPL